MFSEEMDGYVKIDKGLHKKKVSKNASDVAYASAEVLRRFRNDFFQTTFLSVLRKYLSFSKHVKNLLI